MSVDIGDVIGASGLPASTLHVWERHGLISATGRNGGRRQFADDILERVAVIVLLQRSGFHLGEIVDLLRPDAFDDGKAVLEAKLARLRERRALLDAAIGGIEHALHCPEPSPLECDGFRAHLCDLLPVDADERPLRPT